MSGWVTPFGPLEEGQILDMGYGEFLCTPRTLEELQAGGMTHVNETPVHLTVVDHLPACNAVVVKYHSIDGDNLNTEWARYWAKQNTIAKELSG